MTVRRRRVLQSLAAPTVAGLTGCSRVAGSGPEPFEITDVDSTIIVDFPLDLTVSVHRRQATPEHPAALTVSWQNNSDQTVSLVDSGVLTLDQVTNEQENALFLNRAKELGTTEFSGCWMYTPDVLSGPGVVRIATLDPGDILEAVAGFYSFKSGLLVIDECLPAGKYTFSLGGSIRKPAEGRRVDIDWQLEVTLTRRS